MNSKNMFFPSVLIVLYILSGSLIISCGQWGWQPVEPVENEKLNVFGLISLDDSLESFVIVDKTLGTGPNSDIFVGYDTTFWGKDTYFDEDSNKYLWDTLWYDPPRLIELYDKPYFVQDAEVIVSDGMSNYLFTLGDFTDDPDYSIYDRSDLFLAKYICEDPLFIPRHNTNYILDVSTPSGMHLTGSVLTPPKISFFDTDLEDTLNFNNPNDITLDKRDEYGIEISSTTETGQEYICSSEQDVLLEPGDTSWVYRRIPDYCYGAYIYPDTVMLITFRLRNFDENYFNYFIEKGDVAVSNFFLGEGSFGTAYGVEGGYGIFGSYSTDYMKRYVSSE